MLDKTIDQLIQEIDSNSPTPGGGSISALIVSISIALTRMCGHISSQRKSFASLDDSSRQQYNKIFEQLMTNLSLSKSIIIKDEETFKRFMEFYKIKTFNEIEKSEKQLKLNEQIIESAQIVIELAKCINDSIICCDKIQEYITKNIYSDLIVSIIYLKASFESCKVTLKINLDWLGDFDKSITEKLWEEINSYQKNIYYIFDNLYNKYMLN